MSRLLSLAVRNLGRRRLRTFATVSAIALGVMALLLLRGMTSAIQHVNRSLLIDGVLGALQVHPAGWSEAAEMSPLSLDFEDTADLRRAIAAVPGVRAVAPRITFGAGLQAGDAEARYFVATAIEPVAEAQVTPLRVEWVSRWPASADEAAVVPSAELADGLPVEDLALLASDRDELLNGEPVRIGGTAKSGLPGNRRYAFVPLGLAQRLLRMEGRVTEYGVALQPGADAAEVKRGVAAALGPGYEVHTWSELMPFLAEIERGQDGFGLTMGFILLTVVLLGVGSTMQMNVMDRVREVGTLLALGARRSTVRALFVLEGLVQAGVGVGLGSLFGFSALAALRAADLRLAAPGSELPQRIVPAIELHWAVVYVAATVLGAVLASYFPARSAARLEPAGALRES